MRTRPTVIYFSPAERTAPDLISAWVEQTSFTMLALSDAHAVETTALRNPPALIIIDGDGSDDQGVELCRSLKGDPYPAIVPIAFVAGHHGSDQVGDWFDAGADEVLTPIVAPTEQRSRLGVLLSLSATQISITSRSSTIATATTMAIALSLFCRGSCGTSSKASVPTRDSWDTSAAMTSS